MRWLLFALTAPSLLVGCATGYATDWFRPRPSIVSPQLLRFGMDVSQTRCVAQRLAAEMDAQGLRRFQLAAAAVQQGISEPERLTPGDLKLVARRSGDQLLPRVLDIAYPACGVVDAPPLAALPVQIAAAADSPATGSAPGSATGGAIEGNEQVQLLPSGSVLPAPTSGDGQVRLLPPGSVLPAPGVAQVAGADNDAVARRVAGISAAPFIATTATGAVSATWLNLGSASSGQSIAIDAASIGQEGATRTAWFRMTDPETGGRTPNHFRLRINCETRAINPLARRQVDDAGTVTDFRDYDSTEPVQQVENGTVTEIAFLSLCT